MPSGNAGSVFLTPFRKTISMFSSCCLLMIPGKSGASETPRIAWAMPSSCVSSAISALCLTTSKRPHTRWSRSWPSNWRLIRVCFPFYASRRRTQTDHQLHVQAYLKFRRATPLDFYALHTWLVERALEHDKPTLLLQLACEKLSREQIVRPGVTRLERLVATARDQAHDETFRRLTPLLTDERKAFLDGLLTPDPHTGRTLLSWLRQEAVSHAASQIIATLHKIAFLHDTGVAQWDLASLNPNRAKWLAQIGWKSTNQHLQRMAPLRRYPVLRRFSPAGPAASHGRCRGAV